MVTKKIATLYNNFTKEIVILLYGTKTCFLENQFKQEKIKTINVSAQYLA